ncbi:MAG TPA: hypothetical protein PK264_17660 [Hyphomicrobiaceae bacterium]|nr:hypothetical protein [Hyphomicrobiaceae bacterium]
MYRLLLTSGNIVASLLLGAIAMVVFALYNENAFEQILNGAAQLKSWMVSTGLPTKWNNFVRLFLDEKTIVFSGFTIATRIVLAILIELGRALFSSPAR